MTLALVVRRGTVYDGTDGEPMEADVAIEDGRIAAVGSVLDVDCSERDANGLAIAGGLIDLHSHSDYTLLVDPRAVSANHHGVMTEMVGSCGFCCFAIRDPRPRGARSTATRTTSPSPWRASTSSGLRRRSRRSTC